MKEKRCQEGRIAMRDRKKMETLEEFRFRTQSFNQNSLPLEGMETNPGLIKKVNQEGNFLEYRGNTVVFVLPREIKEKISVFQEKLYSLCREILAEPLEADTFHLTLHDLASGPPSGSLEHRIRETRFGAAKKTAGLSREGETIRLRSTFLFNMVNTSMVLGFEPEEEESCQRLMRYYEAFQETVRLSYPLTPHVTVAYFRPGRISGEQIGRLQEAVDFVKAREQLKLELTGAMLEYQEFSDMNHYWRGCR